MRDINFQDETFLKKLGENVCITLLSLSVMVNVVSCALILINKDGYGNFIDSTIIDYCCLLQTLLLLCFIPCSIYSKNVLCLCITHLPVICGIVVNSMFYFSKINFQEEFNQEKYIYSIIHLIHIITSTIIYTTYLGYMVVNRNCRHIEPVIEPVIMNANPILPLSSIHINNYIIQNEDKDVTEICSICLEDLKIFRCSITECGHKFHKECIENWIRRDNNSCPNCRIVIVG